MSTPGQTGIPSPQRILVVDDEQPILKIVKVILNRAHYDVATCETAEAAIHLLRKEPFDCVITDAIMPGTNGYDFVKSIRKEPFGDIPVLMLTRKRHRQDVKKAVEAGITDYVIKPIDEHLLLDKVEMCLKKGGGKRYILECGVLEAQSKAELSFSCKITSVSETYLTIVLSIPIPYEAQFEMDAPIFEEIGIQAPMIKLITCKELPNPANSGHIYEAKFSFIGVQEVDLRKIRNWLNREEIRRRK